MPKPPGASCYVDVVTARTAMALLGACSTLGCADMLGLGGLTFDQTASGGAASLGTGGGGSGGQGSDGSGATPGSGGFDVGAGGQDPVGSGGAPPSFEDDYPATWPSGALVTAAWPGFGAEAFEQNSTFWVYSPESGTLARHRLDLDLPDWLGDSAAPPGWDLAYAPQFAGTPWLFGYDAQTGLVDYGPAPAPGDALASTVAAGSPGWTHFVLAGNPQSPYLIAADAPARLVRIGPADPDTEDPQVSVVTWDVDFSDLLAFRWEDLDGVLRLDRELGAAAFVPIEDGTLGAPTELALALTRGWDLVASFPAAGGAGLVVYYADTGIVETRVSTGGASTFQHDDATWQRDVDAIVPVTGGGEARALTYDADTGVAALHGLVPLSPVVVVK